MKDTNNQPLLISLQICSHLNFFFCFHLASIYMTFINGQIFFFFFFDFFTESQTCQFKILIKIYLKISKGYQNVTNEESILEHDPLSYRNQSTDLLCKSMNWFPYIGPSVMKELNATGVLINGKQLHVKNHLFITSKNHPSFYEMFKIQHLEHFIQFLL